MGSVEPGPAVAPVSLSEPAPRKEPADVEEARKHPVLVHRVQSAVRRLEKLDWDSLKEDSVFVLQIQSVV